MHRVLIVHFVVLFVDSKDIRMIIWVRGKYTAMMMMMMFLVHDEEDDGCSQF